MMTFAIIELPAIVAIYIVAGWVSWRWDWPLRVGSWEPFERGFALGLFALVTGVIFVLSHARQP